MKEDQLVYTVKEVQHLLHLSRGKTYEAVRTGALPSIRIGRRILIPVLALSRLLAGAGTPPPESEEEEDAI